MLKLIKQHCDEKGYEYEHESEGLFVGIDKKKASDFMRFLAENNVKYESYHEGKNVVFVI